MNIKLQNKVQCQYQQKIENNQIDVRRISHYGDNKYADYPTVNLSHLTAYFH